MMYVVIGFVLVTTVLISCFYVLLKQLKTVTEQYTIQKDANKKLRYQIDILKDVEDIKNEARKKNRTAYWWD